jgi:Asp-tRNA(Asn)/Glu-tRNA(Gln) amidotransferase A subunit family amidase
LDHRIINKQHTIGIPHKNFLNQAEAEILDAFDLSVNAIKNAGLRVVETNLFENIDEINKHHKALAAKEFSEVHEKWFAQYGHLYSRPSCDLMHEGQKVDQCMVREIHKHIQKAPIEIEKTMDDEGIDAWISPAATSLPLHGLSSTGSPLMNLPWTFTGVPCITIPAGKPKLALPQGLQISGRMKGLKDLFDFAGVLEKILR